MKETVADTVLRVIGEATGTIHLTSEQMEEDLPAWRTMTAEDGEADGT